MKRGPRAGVRQAISFRTVSKTTGRIRPFFDWKNASQ